MISKNPPAFVKEAHIYIAKQSGEVIEDIKFGSELGAQQRFDELAEIKWPNTYKGNVMNCSEYDNAGTIGYMRLVVISHNSDQYIRRELFRKA